MRLYGRALEITRAFILEKQGWKCPFCPEAWTQVDHIDGDPSNNKPSNLRGLCGPCNIRQRNLATGNQNDSVRESYVCVASPHAETDPIAINRAKEPQFLSFCSLQLVHGPVVKRVLKGNASFYCKISPATVDRYLVKYCSTLGPFHEYTDTDGGEIVIGLRK